LELVDSLDRNSISLPIDIDDEAWKLSPNKKLDWADFTFGHMPLGATMPIFTKFKNDVSTRNNSLRELILARALYKCGDFNNEGYQILNDYSKDLRGHYYRHASGILELNNFLPKQDRN
jgi:hypothetical protein